MEIDIDIELEHQDYRMSDDEYFKILNNLVIHHSLFYQLWLLGKPVFSHKTPTAQISFNKEGHWIEFLINPEFWDTLNNSQKLFVVGHECLHVLFNHGFRGIDALTDRNKGVIANKVMDIVVNHALVNKLSFTRSEIDPENKYCWIDTIFREHTSTIKENSSFEYYYSKYLELFSEQDMDVGEGGNNAQSTSGIGDGELVDDHSNFGNELDNDALSDILNEIKDKIPNKEKEVLKEIMDQLTADKDNKNKGNESGGKMWVVPLEKVSQKKKWETVIKKWSAKYLIDKEKDVDQWARVNRRFVLLPDSLMLPSEMEIDDDKDKKRITVWFFSDTSGSCASYATRFFKAAESLPKKTFDVKMHCFDTKVYETTLESRKLYGFGGTSFHILENYIQNQIKKEKLDYPPAVFVITDGYGTNIKPQYPDRWYWFLTPYGLTNNIDKGCKIFNLTDYE